LKGGRKEFKAKAQGIPNPAQGNENPAQGNEKLLSSFVKGFGPNPTRGVMLTLLFCGGRQLKEAECDLIMSRI
jgi:hypothetical protein